MLQFRRITEERLNFAFIYFIIALKLFFIMVNNNELKGVKETILVALIPLLFFFVSFSFLFIGDKKYQTLSLLKYPAYFGLIYLLFF